MYVRVFLFNVYFCLSAGVFTITTTHVSILKKDKFIICVFYHKLHGAKVLNCHNNMFKTDGSLKLRCFGIILSFSD